MNVTVAKLRIRQSQNVEHGLLPFPPLRDNGRCRMLGIHSGGVRHPSSETNTTASRVVRSRLMSGCRWNVRCRIVPAFVCSEMLFVPLYSSQQAAGYTNPRRAQCCAYTIVRAIRRAVNSIVCETLARVTSTVTALWRIAMLNMKIGVLAAPACSGDLDKYAHSPYGRGMHLPGDGGGLP
jgi:hypothetical protein